MQMLTGRCGDIAPQLFEEVGRYRHKVFVEMLKWELLIEEPGIERDQFDRESSPYFATARLWDDGIILPSETRRVLGLAFSATLNALIPETKFGVFRM